jgi:AraC family transcriptional regulator, transcriptional activator of pobA
MNGNESLEDFYRSKLNHVPENLKKGIGHFNVFKVEDYVGPHKNPIPYSRRDYYKITLIKGRNLYHYADKTVEIKSMSLLFTNPMIPYNWEPLDDEQTGYFCIFTQDFFNSFGSFKEYPIFQPGATPLYELTSSEFAQTEILFEQMFSEIDSSYTFKLDLIRTLVIQLIHTAMKLKPAESTPVPVQQANDRITALFADLLERQFLIESPLQRMKLRSPADFASHLAIHINHLNRSLKSITGKTTSQLIAERILQEARVLLKHTDWNVSQIGYCLGFDEPSHFITFFRKNVALTPKAFRNASDQE